MAAEKRKVKKWGGKTLLALLGLAAAGAFGFFSIFNTVRVAAAEPALSENEANEAGICHHHRCGTGTAAQRRAHAGQPDRTVRMKRLQPPEAQGIAAGEQPTQNEV